MAREAAWRTYSKLRQSRRKALAVGAKRFIETGDERYYDRYKKFMKISDSVVRQTNQRLRELEKRGLDYGHPYNNLSYYLDIELNGARRLPSTRSLSSGKYDYDNDNQWFMAIEQGMHFLRSPLSTVKGRESSNEHRVQKLQEMDVLPSADAYGNKADWRDYEDFLRFLGNEEIATAIDSWGDSDIVVEALWDYWNRDENNRANNIRLMKMGFAQYLAGEKTFDEALLDRGVKIEDYISKKYKRDGKYI